MEYFTYPDINMATGISDLQRTGPELRPSTSWINALPARVDHRNVF